MKTRLINKNDLRQLAELFDEYRVFYEKKSDIKAAEIFLIERFENKESVIFVAEKENKELLGFVQLYPLFSSTRMKRMWLLNDLYVAENQRGKGISKLLIDAAKDLCKETSACSIILETAKSNLIGNQLYTKTNFSLDEDHNYYYWDFN